VEHAASGWITASPRGATIAGGLIRAARSFRLSARPAASTFMAAFTSGRGPLPFQIDDVGWTDIRDG